MKLEIGKNIRKRRREADMTQEELAERLGVSYQAVSRWENGTTYPDIELLPVLAGMFGCTLDELVGEVKDEKIERYWSELKKIPDDDRNARCELFRRAFAEFPNEFSFGQCLCIELAYRFDIHDENVVNEIRHVALDILNRCTDDALARTDAIESLSIAETDDRFGEILEQYVPIYDISRHSLLCKRYEIRNEMEAYRMLTHRSNIDAIKNLFDMDFDPTEPSPQKDPAVSLPSFYARLNFLNSIIGIEEETRRSNPLFGDGVLDMWFNIRMMCGFRMSCRLAAMNKLDEALDLLEKITAMYERFFDSVKVGTVLSYRTDSTHTTDAVVDTVYNEDGWKTIQAQSSDERYVVIKSAHMLNVAGVFWAGRYYDVLARREGWEWFDPIREHPRYIACMERMKKAGHME